MKRFQIVILFLLTSVTHACLNSDCLAVDPTCSPLTAYILYNPVSDIIQKRHLVVHGNTTNTSSVYDPATHQFVSGPTLSGNVSIAGHSFRTKNVDRYWEALVIHGSDNQTSIWQATTGTSYGSFVAGPNLTGNLAAGGRSFPVNSGTQDGKFYIVHAGGLNTTSLFNPATNTIQAGSNTSAAVDNTSTITFTPIMGVFAGQTILPRKITPPLDTDRYNPTTNTFISSSALTASSTDGGSVFKINSGPQIGNFFVVLGNAATTLNMFTSSTSVFSSIIPALTAGVSIGGFNITLSNGKTLIIHGGNTNVTTLYDPATDSHTPGPTLPFNVNGGANGFPIEWGLHTGKYIIVPGNAAVASALYDPVANTFTIGPTLTGIVNTGASNFEIPVLDE